jgi:hypothetical protein
MGWKFISGEQAEKKTKVTDHDVVRFIVDPQPAEGNTASRKFNSSAIVRGIATFLRKQTEGMPKQDRAALEYRLHAAITKVLRTGRY